MAPLPVYLSLDHEEEFSEIIIPNRPAGASLLLVSSRNPPRLPLAGENVGRPLH